MSEKGTPAGHALVVALACLWLGGCSAGPPAQRAVRFSEQPLRIQDYYLFDLGVADADGDGNLDLFTSNHTALPSLLLGDGRGGFRDVYAEWRLSQRPEFPGLEDSWTAPDIGGEGVSISWHRRRLVIRASLPDRTFDISGRLVADCAVALVETAGWKCALEPSPSGPDRTRTQVTFRLGSGLREGTIILEPELPEVGQTVTFEPSIPLTAITVGRRGAHPRDHTFEVSLKDRHGIAWADWNGDGRPDAFIAGGGVSGRIADFPEVRPYELFVTSEFGLVEMSEALNLVANGGRSRQPAWVDIDGDNRLELFVYGIWSRCQLFASSPRGGFADVTARTGLLNPRNGFSAWFDADGDLDPDLLVSGRDELFLYRNVGGVFSEVRLGPNPRAVSGAPPEYRQFGRPAFSDFDGDGDIDIYLASANGSTVLLNRGGRFRALAPAVFGLPVRAAAAAWVDADNDSFPDLHSVPDGLFRQTEGRRFERTGLLASGPGEPPASARSLWFDADNDGDRDVLIAVLPADREASRVWTSRFLRNDGPGGHWLEVRVAGPPGNREAVGAAVVLELGDGRRLKEYVGLAEGSYYSQGHYRVYFGLGRTGRPAALTVLWPDGLSERIDDPGIDRILTCGRGQDPRGR